ncbi:c-type cytochrome [Nitrogeniibacter aestuarii]|uniref:c-type cytochrome n=1 Tax=Nitrogeniibacter aestuarii TaxID=2815343 RepID=UPI001D1258AF|nr:cytochrome c [Nitrogeniibacter aestuarii]
MKLQWMAVLVATLACAPALAGGDPAAGKEKSAVCAACHGADGNSPTPMFPKLAGQHEDYLVRALTDYKLKNRKNEIMAGQVEPLSSQDIADLAAFFASQKGLVVKK